MTTFHRPPQELIDAAATNLASEVGKSLDSFVDVSFADAIGEISADSTFRPKDGGPAFRVTVTVNLDPDGDEPGDADGFGVGRGADA